jgi:hypothetical protein
MMVIHSYKQERQKDSVVGIYIPRVGLTKKQFNVVLERSYV